MVSFEVVVGWSPVHELLASFWAFTDHRLAKHLDIDRRWRSDAAEQLGLSSVEFLNLYARDSKARLCVHALLRECPEPMIPERFLDWLGKLSGEDILRYRLPWLPQPRDVRESLSKWRDDLVAALKIWNHGYFSSVDSTIMRSLEMESRTRSSAIAREDPQNAVEDATNGIYLQEDLGIEKVLLTPQYHCRPYNIYDRLANTAFYMYPIDLQSAADGDPPARLERLARAFSDPGRLRVLRFLNGQARSFTEILKFTGLAKSTVNYHMVVLRAAGIVRVIETRNGSLYTLRPGYHTGIGDLVRHYVEDRD